MTLRKIIYIFAVGLVTLSCGVAKHKSAQLQPATQMDDSVAVANRYPGESQLTYLYTEGLKANVLGADSTYAISMFNKVLSVDSTHAPSYYELANIYIGEPQKALFYSRKAVELDSTNAWYATQLGRTLIISMRYDEALDVYRTLMRLSPNNPENYRLTAALYEQLKQPFTAISILDSAETRFGLNPELSIFKRQLLMDVKLYDKALKEAQQIIDNFPYDEKNLVVLAELYAAMGKDSLALETYDKATSINPNNTQTLVSLNEYYKRKQNNVGFISTAKQLFNASDIPLETKIEFYNEIIKTPGFYRDFYFHINDMVTTLAIKYPLESSVTDLYASHLIAGGNIEEALKLYKSHIDDTKKSITVFNNIMDMEAYLNRPDSLAKYADIAIKAFPSNPDLHLRKGGVTAFYMKDYKGAKVAYKQALKYATTDSIRSVVYCSLGDNAHYMNQTKQSYAYYEKGLKYDSLNAIIYNNYSYFLSTQGQKLDLALQMSEKANKLDVNNPTYLDTHAWILYKLGRYEEAQKLIKQAISLDKTASAELMVHYGDILHALKEEFMAAMYWKKALEKGYDKQEIEKRLKLTE